MCQECGCGLRGDAAEASNVFPDASPRRAAPPHPDAPSHAHFHAHAHADNVVSAPSMPAPGASATPHQVLEVQRSLLERNDRWAEQNRGFFRAKRLFVLNVLSAPGSGKTTLIQKTAGLLRRQGIRVGVVVGDLATDNDARRLREAGLPVVQISTGTLCHLEGDMVARAVDQLDTDHLDLLVIENVGNLVCPAAFDLGEHLRVVLLSVTEGEDKPLKYPPLFHSADVALLTKMDLVEILGFDRATALDNLRRISHHARVFEVSARTEQGMAAWANFLLERRAAWLEPSPACSA